MSSNPGAPRAGEGRHSSVSDPRLESGSEPMQTSIHLPSSPRSEAALPRGRSAPGARRRWPRARWFLLLGALALVALAVWLVAHELRTSAFQARELSRIAREARFVVEPGPSPSIRFPTGGPFDERLGYTRVPDFVAPLSAPGFGVERQARHSERLVRLDECGLNPA